MKRKKFITQLAIGVGGLALFPTIASCSKSENGIIRDPDVKVPEAIKSAGKIRFGVITDVHHDFFPEAKDRLAKFITTAKEEKVDFIIQVGDFVYPRLGNGDFVDVWNSFTGPKFHTLGNHDMDVSSKAIFMDFVGHDRGAHYSYDHSGFHFVVLDTNYIKEGNSYTHYVNKNYASHAGNEIGFVSQEQLDWLKNDLAKTDKPTIVFSHQHLNGSAGNSAAIQKIFKDENAKGKKVIASFSGHNHQNWHLSVDDIHHVQVNSSSYFFVGKKFPLVSGRYPEDIEKKYPILPEMAPYDDSLFAIVEVDGPNRTLNIDGRESNFVAPSPYDLGYYKNTGQMSPSSNLDSRILKF